ncbi:MAG: phosphatase PAP2 family protein [Vulcanococcus sp.]
MNRSLPVLRAWLAALGPWRLLFALITAIALATLGPSLAASRKPPFDLAVLDAVHSAIPDGIGPLLLRVYQLSGVHVSAVLVLAVLIFLAMRRFWADLVCLAVGTGGILLIVDRWLKPMFERRRPMGRLLDDISGRSFPSGHAAGSVVFYFMACALLAAHYPRLRRPLFLAASVWVGLVWLSTLYVRAHWLTDIAAGAALGYVWLSFCLAGLTVWERHQARRLAPPSPPPSAHG